eukprot:c13519_g1_i1 orf=67-939(+)
MAEMGVECEVDSQAAEGKKRPREEGEEGENAEKKLCSSPAAEAAAEEEKSTLLPGTVPEEAAEEEKDTLLPDTVAAEAAAEEEKETLLPDTVETAKDEEVPAEAEVEKGESPPALVGDGELGKASEKPTEAKVGPKVFTSSMDMFNFFYDLLRTWPLNFNLNKYEHLMLENLISQGHQEPQKKIGAGIEAFQVRMNPEFYSRCYYIVRSDGSVEDFSYRKCVDNILPLPEEFKARSGDLRVGNKHKGQGGHGGHHDNRGRGGWGGGGRGGGRRGGGGGYGRGNRGRGGRF